MDRTPRKSAKLKRGRRRRRGRLLLVAIAVIGFVVFLLVSGTGERDWRGSSRAETSALRSTGEDLSVARFHEAKPQRKVYPYSVIPGGVQGVQELKSAVAKDPVVAAHYQGFDVSSARATRASQDRAVYVSYRLGDKTYWTRRKVKVAKGEALISDGSHTARTRCGNLVSDTPKLPVSTGEPTAEALDMPLGLGGTGYLSEDPARQPEQVQTASLGAGGGAGNSPTSFVPFAPVIGGFAGGAGQGDSSDPDKEPTPPPPPPPPPPVSTPEPSTLMLLAIGSSTLLFLRKR